MHTTVAVFGSAEDDLASRLEPPLEALFTALVQDPRLGEGLSIAHGSGPGVMRAADNAAVTLGLFRFGVGLGAEKLGQAPNLSPEALAQFTTLALNTRQDILDRRSLFKIFTLGGFGTSYEINMALTFLKIGHCLPAPYLFFDPLGAGEDSGNLWAHALKQFSIIACQAENACPDTPPLGPAWIARCCHPVQTWQNCLEIITGFMDNPAAYWQEVGIPIESVREARDSLILAGTPIPPYVEAALG